MPPMNFSSPVFCTAKIPADLLTNFFEETYSPSELTDPLTEDEVVDIGVLVNTEDVSSIDQPTIPPVPEQSSWPFEGKSVEEIWNFAQKNLNRPIYKAALAILDEQTVKDKETCLLVKEREFPEDDQSKLLTVRSDFKSAIMILNVINLAIGGDEHFGTTDSEGIIRYEIIPYSAN